MGGGEIADVREVEGQQGTEIGGLQGGPDPGQPLVTQAVEIDALLPVDGVGSVGANGHRITAFSDHPESNTCRRGCQVSLDKPVQSPLAERDCG